MIIVPTQMLCVRLGHWTQSFRNLWNSKKQEQLTFSFINIRKGKMPSLLRLLEIESSSISAEICSIQSSTVQSDTSAERHDTPPPNRNQMPANQMPANQTPVRSVFSAERHDTSRANPNNFSAFQFVNASNRNNASPPVITELRSIDVRDRDSGSSVDVNVLVNNPLRLPLRRMVPRFRQPEIPLESNNGQLRLFFGHTDVIDPVAASTINVNIATTAPQTTEKPVCESDSNQNSGNAATLETENSRTEPRQPDVSSINQQESDIDLSSYSSSDEDSENSLYEERLALGTKEYKDKYGLSRKKKKL